MIGSIPVEKSNPFQPEAAVSASRFIGRKRERKKIEQLINDAVVGMTRSAVITGSSGIGKSSLALFMSHRYDGIDVEADSAINTLHVNMSGVENTTGFLLRVHTKLIEQINIKGWENYGWVYDGLRAFAQVLVRHAKREQTVNIKIDNPSVDRKEIEDLVKDPNFLMATLKRYMKGKDGKGKNSLILVLGYLNGVVSDGSFASFFKGLQEGFHSENLPFLSVLCMTRKHYDIFISKHEAGGRVFTEVLDLKPLEDVEVQHFFQRTFDSREVKISPDDLDLMVDIVDGNPSYMQRVGYEIFGLVGWREAASTEQVKQGIIDSMERIKRDKGKIDDDSPTMEARIKAVLDSDVRLKAAELPIFQNARIKRTDLSDLEFDGRKIVPNDYDPLIDKMIENGIMKSKDDTIYGYYEYVDSFTRLAFLTELSNMSRESTSKGSGVQRVLEFYEKT